MLTHHVVEDHADGISEEHLGFTHRRVSRAAEPLRSPAFDKNGQPPPLIATEFLRYFSRRRRSRENVLRVLAAAVK